jgi:hypothetical protein
MRAVKTGSTFSLVGQFGMQVWGPGGFETSAGALSLDYTATWLNGSATSSVVIFNNAPVAQGFQNG